MKSQDTGALIYTADDLSAAVQEAIERCAKIAESYDEQETAHILDEGSRIAYDTDKYSWRIARDIRALVSTEMRQEKPNG